MSELTWKDKLQLIGQLKQREKELFEALYRAFDGQQHYPIPLDEMDVLASGGLGTDSTSAEINDAHLSDDMELLEQIEHALDHSDARRFGRCIDCGAEIPVQILRQVPWTLRCARHQGDHEVTRAASTGVAGP